MVVGGAVDDQLGCEATQDDIGGDSPVLVFGREVEELGDEGKLGGLKADRARRSRSEVGGLRR